jgi:hypothetical protein
VAAIPKVLSQSPRYCNTTLQGPTVTAEGMSRMFWPSLYLPFDFYPRRILMLTSFSRKFLRIDISRCLAVKGSIGFGTNHYQPNLSTSAVNRTFMAASDLPCQSDSSVRDSPGLNSGWSSKCRMASRLSFVTSTPGLSSISRMGALLKERLLLSIPTTTLERPPALSIGKLFGTVMIISALAALCKFSFFYLAVPCSVLYQPSFAFHPFIYNRGLTS